ncbi:MAG: FKBP-type peptidyl-prolyl cis-trans isomerase [bacterium]|nr:FKBP-type peptidyl-prolyl cis-trans isomerase [bacterium]
MNPTQTGIAVALALTVVALFFIFPGANLFGNQAPTENPPIDLNSQTADSAQPTMPTEPVTELMMKDDVVGTGATASSGDSVTVNYVGALTNGTVFDASANHKETLSGFTFNLGAGQVIKGWDQGIVGMKEGGKRTLVIPASLAYGPQAVGDVIPANADLIFQVELLKVQKK